MSRDTFLQEIDQLIRDGRLPRAAALLNAFAQSAVPSREHALAMAALARRAQVPELGLRLLRARVRPGARSSLRPSPEELLEFAACLNQRGIVWEAIQILDLPVLSQLPRTWLFRAYACFSEWDYAGAIPLLLKYVAAPDLDSYARLVGEANLAAALVHERQSDAAETLLARIEDATRAGGYSLLLASILELKAENAIQRSLGSEAESRIAAAFRHSETAGRPNLLFLKKWNATLELGRASKPRELRAARELLREVRVLATQAGDSETLRECDYHEAVRARQAAPGLHVYFGTPFLRYRERLLSDAPWLLEGIPETYARHLGEPSDEFIQVWNGRHSGRSEELKVGQAMQRLLAALNGDFYRAPNLSALHAKVFPDRYYIPGSSAEGMRQVLLRLRKFLSTHAVPLEIRERSGNYFLATPSGIDVLVRREMFPSETRNQQTAFRAERVLVEEFGYRGFGAEEAARALRVSRNSALSRLRELMAVGEVSREGRGSKTRYRILRS